MYLSPLEESLRGRIEAAIGLLDALDLAKDRTLPAQQSLMKALGALEVELQHYTKVVIGNMAWIDSLIPSKGSSKGVY